MLVKLIKNISTFVVFDLKGAPKYTLKEWNQSKVDERSEYSAKRNDLIAPENVGAFFV